MCGFENMSEVTPIKMINYATNSIIQKKWFMPVKIIQLLVTNIVIKDTAGAMLAKNYDFCLRLLLVFGDKSKQSF